MQISTEEAILLRKLQQGDESVIERLIQLSEPVILNTAKQFANKGLTLDELQDIGKQTLIKCAKTEIGNTGRERFFRLGGWWVRQGILKLLATHVKIYCEILYCLIFSE